MKLGSRIATKYAVSIGLLMAGVITVMLLFAAVITKQYTDAVDNRMQDALTSAQVLNETQALERSANYLGNRLFNPLYNFDITALNEEIAQIRSWLPVTEFLILDHERRILTDGSLTNPRHREQAEVPADLSPGKPKTVHAKNGHIVYFVIGHREAVQGYARVALSNAALNESLETLRRNTEGIWFDYRKSLAIFAAATMLFVMLLLSFLSWRLSLTIARPLEEMSEAAGQFAQGNLNPLVPVRSDDELGKLADSLNRMAQNLRRNRRMLAKAQEIAGVGSWEWHPRGMRMVWSEQVFRIFGLDPFSTDPSVPAMLARMVPESRAATALRFDPAHPLEPFSAEVRINTPQGKEKRLQLQGEPLIGADGSAIGITGVIQDVTEQRQAQEKLSFLANFDPLTGLPNRYLFQDRLRQAIRKADRSGNQVALLFIDLDRFKSVNDALGHIAGDQLLKEAAARLLATVRESDTVARLGGDEFTVILEDIDRTDRVAAIAQKTIDQFSRGFLVADREVYVGASIGITLYPSDAPDVGTLLKNADTAMYFAKESGSGIYHFFTADLNRRAQERLALDQALRKAMEAGEFELHYQPQVSLKTGQLQSVEALLRWPKGPPGISPLQFIPVLEENGLIVSVGGWVLDRACAQVRRWQRAGLGDLRVAVNFSARQFQQSDIVDVIAGALQRSGLKPECLEVEITESTLLDSQISVDTIDRLQSLGVRLAIDDFGTGYSSLTYLKRLFVDTLKIDRSFVRDIITDQDDAAISSAIVNLGKSLEIEVMAEGVETPEQLEFLRASGCHMAQGYLISPPLPPEELSRWAGMQTFRDGACYWRGPVIPSAVAELAPEH